LRVCGLFGQLLGQPALPTITTLWPIVRLARISELANPWPLRPPA